MSNGAKVSTYSNLDELSTDLREILNKKDYILIYAYNNTGKTRISMKFKEHGGKQGRDTLYFNAFTEDLFSWDNDLENDNTRHLKMNADSRFFDGLKELTLEEKISSYVNRYTDFDFKIDYDIWMITFYRGDIENIKISRGEEHIFIWCIFMAICEVVFDESEAYKWVKYLYIDDPISSLDDNNAIAVACDLAGLLRNKERPVKTVISSHHGLFFNVMCNELKKEKHKQYFLHCTKNFDTYTLRETDDTPFFYHVAMLGELKQAAESGDLFTYHFNVLRSILEKTAAFFGYSNFSACIHGVDDEKLYARALNLLSHSEYSVFQPVKMVEDNEKLFTDILNAFLEKYRFNIPELTPERTGEARQA